MAAVVAAVTLALSPSARSDRRTAAGVAAARGRRGRQLGLMSRHSLPGAAGHRHAVHQRSRGPPTTDWLRGQDGSTISFTDDLRAAEYGVPGLRPNANVLVGVPSIDGYDGGVQVTERWATALRRFTPDPVTDLPLRNNVPVPLDTVRSAGSACASC